MHGACCFAVAQCSAGTFCLRVCFCSVARHVAASTSSVQAASTSVNLPILTVYGSSRAPAGEPWRGLGSSDQAVAAAAVPGSAEDTSSYVKAVLLKVRSSVCLPHACSPLSTLLHCTTELRHGRRSTAAAGGRGGRASCSIGGPQRGCAVCSCRWASVQRGVVVIAAQVRPPCSCLLMQQSHTTHAACTGNCMGYSSLAGVARPVVSGASWPGCIRPGVSLAWWGRRCESKPQLTEWMGVYAFDTQNGSRVEACTRERGSDAAENELWLGSCGTAPKVSPNTPVDSCMPSPGGCRVLLCQHTHVSLCRCCVAGCARCVDCY